MQTREDTPEGVTPAAEAAPDPVVTDPEAPAEGETVAAATASEAVGTAEAAPADPAPQERVVAEAVSASPAEPATPAAPVTAHADAPADAPAATTAQTDAPSGEPRDFEAELAAATARLNELAERVTTIGIEDEAQRAEIAEQINAAIAAREQILTDQLAEQDRQQQAALQQTNTQVEQVSQATQTLDQTVEELQRQLDEQLARANKLELLTGEFSDLIAYKDLIVARTDIEEMRAQCQKIREIREADRSEIRRMTGSERPSGPQGQGYPARIEVTDDPEEIDALLEEAYARGGYDEFLRVQRQIIKRNEMFR